MVDKGRNVVTVSRDGSCKLWNVGKAKCLANVAKYESVINACAIAQMTSDESRSLLPDTLEPVSM